MRKEPTDAERKLWSLLRGKQIEGFRFRRQFPIAGFIVDFFCLEVGVAIEADGGQHVDPKGAKYDLSRDRILGAQGVRVLRFSDRDILLSPDVVAEAILGELVARRPPPRPSPGLAEEGERGGGGG